MTCTACDFGVPPDDNLPDDVAISGFAPANYGAEANFSCSAESGTCVDD